VLFYKESANRDVAFVASKKVGNAVKRNRAKRLLRAHFIQELHRLKNGSYIFVAKEPILESNFAKTSKTLHYIYKKLNLYSNVNN
jgi:ribonuclease P protein component